MALKESHGNIARKLWRKNNKNKIRDWKLKWAKSDNGKASQRRYRSKSAKAMFYLYKGSAKNRRIVFDISEEFFKEMIQKDCVYCGHKSERNGLDRIDNKKGYVEDNLSPCCFRCNQMKGKLTVDEFLNHIMEIINYVIK
mgnify:CR=1 FL=1